MAHLNDNKPKLMARVRRIKGQVEALEKALGEAVDCGEVLTQAAAVRGAAQALMLELLADHLRHHVVAPEDPGAREAGVASVAAALKSYLK
jgi:DNA-binding FrmR family transcriptional regulator